MDYELMMNGNFKIGQMAPDFEAETTYSKKTLQDYRGKWLIFFFASWRFHSCMYNKIYSICKSTSIFSKT